MAVFTSVIDKQNFTMGYNVAKKFRKTMNVNNSIFKALSYFQDMRSIRDMLRNEETHKNCSMVAVNVIAHGNSYGFLKPAGETGQFTGWNIYDVVGTLSDVKALLGKPKLFFVNACRGCKYPYRILRN